jgi:hypothetical protein
MATVNSPNMSVPPPPASDRAADNLGGSSFAPSSGQVLIAQYQQNKIPANETVIIVNDAAGALTIIKPDGSSTEVPFTGTAPEYAQVANSINPVPGQGLFRSSTPSATITPGKHGAVEVVPADVLRLIGSTSQSANMGNEPTNIAVHADIKGTFRGAVGTSRLNSDWQFDTAGRSLQSHGCKRIDGAQLQQLVSLPNVRVVSVEDYVTIKEDPASKGLTVTLYPWVDRPSTIAIRHNEQRHGLEYGERVRVPKPTVATIRDEVTAFAASKGLRVVEVQHDGQLDTLQLKPGEKVIVFNTEKALQGLRFSEQNTPTRANLQRVVEAGNQGNSAEIARLEQQEKRNFESRSSSGQTSGLTMYSIGKVTSNSVAFYYTAPPQKSGSTR